MDTNKYSLKRKSILAATFVVLVGYFTGAAGALLGVVPGYPKFDYDNTGVTNYTAGTMAFSVDADPTALTFNLGDPAAFVVDPRSMKINISVDGLCNGSTGGGGSSDLEVIGDVYDQNFVLIRSGVLLTGDIVSMGQDATGAPTTKFDFRFTNAGGELVTMGDWPAGKDIGVLLTSENSNFTGDCSVSFNGGAKGEIGPIDPEMMGDVCDLTLVKTASPDELGPFYTHHHYKNNDDTDSDSGIDHDKSGDSDDSDSDSEADSDDSDAGPPPCGCKGRVKELTVRYNKPNANTVEVRRGNGESLFGPQVVQPGEEFTFAVKGKRIKFLINMEKIARLKTGCRNPIGSGQTIGENDDLIVVSGLSKFRDPIPLCPYPGSTCDVDHQVTYTYEITNNGTDVTDVVLFDDQLGVIGSIISNIPGVAGAPANVVSVQATTCIFKNTINKATATGLQGVDVCESNEAQETVSVLQDCPYGDTDSDSGIDYNGNNDSDDSDSDSGELDCDRDEKRSCYGSGNDTDSDSGIDHDKSGDSDDSDTDSGTLECDENDSGDHYGGKRHRRGWGWW